MNMINSYAYIFIEITLPTTRERPIERVLEQKSLSYHL